jgi:hypothetical protein
MSFGYQVLGFGGGSTPRGPYVLEWLVIGGGGCGASDYRGGGGGAGGYRNSFASETSGRNAATETPWTVDPDDTITITIGAGAICNQTEHNPGNAGASTTLETDALQTTVECYGGGGGGKYNQNAPAGTYGCGGGSGEGNAATYTGTDGSAGQGFDGGDASASATYNLGSAGGGASANGDGGGVSGTTYGGAGLSSSITGSAVLRAGGGGGGEYGASSPSVGGTGGGGKGGENAYWIEGVDSVIPPVQGTDETGSGGGGWSECSGTETGNTLNVTNGRGGNGVVILRMPDASYSGTTTGSPTVATGVGGSTVITFSGDGTYTA